MKNLGYFGYKYEVYVLSVPLEKHDIERKYSDFMNLRTVLRRFYPGYIVPSLPKNAPYEFTKEILEHYKVEIQKFLNELFSHPLFKD